MGTPGAQANGAKRILAHLEHGPRLPASKPVRDAKWAIDGWTLGLGLLLLAMCGIAWLMHEKSAAPSGFKASYGSTRTSPRHERKDEHIRASTRLDSAMLEPGEVIIEPAELPAAIVNDPATQRMQNRSEQAMTGPRVIGPTAYTLLNSVADTPTPAPATLPAATARAASASASTGAVGKYTSNAHNANATTARATPATAVVAAAASRDKAAAPANDTDVALLTALVAHAGKPAVVAPERSRDIVERRDGDSTAELLARCKQLGLIEGMLCRSRICSGRWDSDATCRVPAN